MQVLLTMTECSSLFIIAVVHWRLVTVDVYLSLFLDKTQGEEIHELSVPARLRVGASQGHITREFLRPCGVNGSRIRSQKQITCLFKFLRVSSLEHVTWFYFTLVVYGRSGSE